MSRRPSGEHPKISVVWPCASPEACVIVGELRLPFLFQGKSMALTDFHKDDVVMFGPFANIGVITDTRIDGKTLLVQWDKECEDCFYPDELEIIGHL
jgi:hypothetical protein